MAASLSRGSMSDEFDLVVIGGGSGGLACAQRAAEYGARVALVESGPPGRHLRERRLRAEEDHVERRGPGAAPARTRTATASSSSCWGTTGARSRAERDAYVHRLNGIYERNLAKRNVELVRGAARFVDAAHRHGRRPHLQRPAHHHRHRRAGRCCRRSPAPSSASPRMASSSCRAGRSGWRSSAAATSRWSWRVSCAAWARRSRWCCAARRVLRDFDADARARRRW